MGSPYRFGVASASLWAEPNLSKISRQAERLFSENLYEDAFPYYSQALSLAEKDELKIQFSNRLAICLIKQRKPQVALTLLSLQPKKENYSHYLMSLAYRDLGETQSALKELDQCHVLSTEDKTMIGLNQGFHLFQLGNLAAAETAFTSIPFDISHPVPYSLARLYLAKIHLIKRNYETALEILQYFDDRPLDSLMALDSLYLKGCLHCTALTCTSRRVLRTTPLLYQQLKKFLVY